jgi:hypothetical protein
MADGRGMTGRLRCGTRAGTQWEGDLDAMALLLSKVSAPVIPCGGRSGHAPCLLGASRRYGATRSGQKAPGSRASLGLQGDAGSLSLLVDAHALQRSEVLRELAADEVAAAGLCGDSSLLTITSLVTRRPQMSG